jgi:hypothetical protein
LLDLIKVNLFLFFAPIVQLIFSHSLIILDSKKKRVERNLFENT